MLLASFAFWLSSSTHSHWNPASPWKLLYLMLYLASLGHGSFFEHTLPPTMHRFMNLPLCPPSRYSLMQTSPPFSDLLQSSSFSHLSKECSSFVSLVCQSTFFLQPLSFPLLSCLSYPWAFPDRMLG